MAMTAVIMAPGVVMIAMLHAISMGATAIPMMPVMAIVPIAIGVTDGDIAKIDGNTGRRSGTGDCYSRSRQRKGNNSAFK